MVDPALSASPSGSLVGLCVAITAAVVVAVPAARWLAGVRSGEAPARTRAATLATAVGLGLWLAVTGALAGAGVLAEFDRFPPPMMPVLAVGVLATVGLALSPFGARLATGLPLALLVGYQGFRVAVEIMLHEAGRAGVIGPQMTWSGLNFDVVSGVLGLALGLWLWRRGELPAPRALLWAYNLIGLALLLTIVSIALMSFPGPLARFDGPANVWVTTVPFVWLPTVMVTAALLGHLVLARRLLATGPATSPATGPSAATRTR